MSDRYIEKVEDDYHPFQDRAELRRDFPLVAVSARINLILALMHADEDALLSRLRQYLIDDSMPLDDKLVWNSHLMELIYFRSFSRSIRSGTIIDLRRELYILLRTYTDHSGIQSLARTFYNDLRDRDLEYSETEIRASQMYDNYLRDVSFAIGHIQSHEPIRAVERIIDNAITESDNARLRTPSSEEFPSCSLRAYINDDCRKSRRAIDRATREGFGCSQEERDSVNMTDLHDFEASYGTRARD